ncbi:biogenesis of lysosome-related organelles complex 1 subunit 2 [Marchantia polymorpha subsp. ruderalis]|uniref:Biogenesis of lysosome-related organelles complex 1 subunit 2 n=1 Tax=Marchantia polymorpha TaxID=3197 RepID=A0A2R6XH48_MARPO|nr:hypothetical protein MARPO_0015s0174 [Marchantia polymorpha]BBN01622.1 hypothetical protein Mp_2g08900 [Marchantia polymorpha subsp. ruderalis]|eukprot:PTQ45389.1 hypothetical protein MARPO_0015s0174 [Marchantia polymorpha]
MADPANPNDDALAKALQSLFVSFASVVQGELQCSNNEYDLLKSMNMRTATEYDNYGDFASGLSSFVERLKQKNERFNQYLEDMEVIDKQVTELEALVSTLDNYTSNLHSQIKTAVKGESTFLQNSKTRLRGFAHTPFP